MNHRHDDAEIEEKSEEWDDSNSHSNPAIIHVCTS